MSIESSLESMNLAELERKLIDLKNQQANIIRCRQHNFQGDYLELGRRIEALERELCKVKNLEYVEPVALGIEMGERPVLLSRYGRSFLLNGKSEAKTEVLVFDHVSEIKFGGINDEVLESHEFFGRGLAVVGEYIVKNSSWKNDLVRKNQVHDNFNPDFWSELNHYLIRTKEGEFSCLAESVSLEVYEIGLEDALLLLSKGA